MLIHNSPFLFSLARGFGITCQPWLAAGRTHVAPLHKTHLPPGGKAAGNSSSILIILLQTPSAETTGDLRVTRSAGGSISFDSSSSWSSQIQGNISEDEAPCSGTAAAQENSDICFYFSSKWKASPGWASCQPQAAESTEQPLQLCCTGHPRAGFLLKTHSSVPLAGERLPGGLEGPNPGVQGKNGSFEGNL